MNNTILYKKLIEAELLSGECRENYWLAHTYQNAGTLDKFNRDFIRLKEVITEVELLLKNTGASTESAHFANTMLGECAASNESSNNEPLAGALGETRAVGQNEQTKELYANPHVCPCCGWQCTCEDQPCSCCSA